MPCSKPQTLSPVSRSHTLGLLCLALCLSVFAPAQEGATITFTLDFPGSDPSHYVISVSGDGNASYQSDGKLSSQSEPADPIRLDFTVSQPTRTRIFDLAKRAHYFAGDIDSKRKGIASTGTKTLSYKNAQGNTQASYNYSPVPAVQELTQLFQNLSTTLEFGRRLEYFRHYQKLALDEELKRMEEISKAGSLQEVRTIAPVLQQIADDSSVINVVRARAQRLLQQSEAAPK